MSILIRLARQAPSLENKADTYAYAADDGVDIPPHIAQLPVVSCQRQDRLRDCPEAYRLEVSNTSKVDMGKRRGSLFRRSDSGYQSISEDTCFQPTNRLDKDLQYVDETYYANIELWKQEEDMKTSYIVAEDIIESKDAHEYNSHAGWSKVTLQQINPELSRYGNVHRIDLSHRRIVCLSPSFARLSSSLTHLNLSNNLLDKLPPSLTTLRNLTSLDVSSNRLAVLPAKIGKLTRLTHLNAAHNVITAIPDSIGSLKKLMTLYLNDNQLSCLPKSIGDLRMLATLDVCRNRMTVIPAEITCLQYLRYIRTEGCDMITEFDTSFKHDPPTLFELAARTIVRNELEAPKDLREDIKEYISSAQKCTFCKGPFFTSVVKRYKLVEKGEQNQIPLEYNLCSAHWNNENERIMAMFTSKPSTSKKPAHVIRAEKTYKSTTSQNSHIDLRTPRYQSRSLTRSATLPSTRRSLIGLPISTSPPSHEIEELSVPDREATASPSSLLSNSATISISSLARKMHVPSASSNTTESIFSASSSENSTPDTAPATMPTRWRAQKIRNRSNTGFLSLSKLQRSSLLASTTNNQNITA
ncbi:hypothetical protein INT43_004412 [Umbelopsis isabellina]|uniref:Disease resistance R13L4/SHOC-2-like LRR domain-containing protein n=1 Tax=Mortierella isabellina TaxID=91625 RepID=A0A8H7PHY9_MORIS|nr:hypothetical protein INT43_004412 [Umbelopsis isabellina]